MTAEALLDETDHNRAEPCNKRTHVHNQGSRIQGQHKNYNHNDNISQDFTHWYGNQKKLSLCVSQAYLGMMCQKSSDYLGYAFRLYSTSYRTAVKAHPYRPLELHPASSAYASRTQRPERQDANTEGAKQCYPRHEPRLRRQVRSHQGLAALPSSPGAVTRGRAEMKRPRTKKASKNLRDNFHTCEHDRFCQ